MENRILRLLIYRVIGFIAFLLLLIILNILIGYIDVPIIKDCVIFLNGQVLFLSIITLLIVLGEIFMMLRFPANLPGPLFSSVGIVFVIYFIFNVFNLLMTLGEVSLDIPFDLIFTAIAVLVFLVVIITEYIGIFKNRSEKIEEEEEERHERHERHEKHEWHENPVKLIEKKKIKKKVKK